MGYNALSGTIDARTVYFADLNSLEANTVSGTLLYGNGTDIANIPRIVANATADNLLTVGANANQMVGESNLTFNGSVLNLNGALTASAGVSASIFYGDGSQLTGISGGGANPIGPTYSVQVKQGDGNISGSSAFSFQSNVLTIAGGLILSRRFTNTSITASTTDYYIGTSTQNGPLSIRLPGASLLGNGQTYVVKDEYGAANTNNVTILASGSQTIDGQNSIVLESPYSSIQLYCNGSNKYFIY